MSIETKAAKQGIKLGVKLAEIYRRWRTRLAWRRNAAKRPAVAVKLSAVTALVTLTGCANLDHAYIKMDDRLFDGSQNPNRYLVPQGYEVRPFVRDASGDRVDITGWTVEEEMVKAQDWTARPLTIDSRGRQQANVLREVADAIREQRTGDAQTGLSGAGDAQNLLLDAAKEAGVQ